MSENKAPRPVQEIQQEYQSLCTKAGHCQYQIFTLNKDLDMFNIALRDLNAEALASAKAKQDAEEQAKASEPKEEQTNA